MHEVYRPLTYPLRSLFYRVECFPLGKYKEMHIKGGELNLHKSLKTEGVNNGTNNQITFLLQLNKSISLYIINNLLCGA